MKKNIAIITNALSDSGVGGRAYELFSRMSKNKNFKLHTVALDGTKNALSVDNQEIITIQRWPSILGSKSISWLRLAKKMPPYDAYEISNQSLAFMAKKRTPAILTVHDVIERTHPQSNIAASLLNRYLLSGIPHAKHIIAVSEYVKQTIIDTYDIPSENITVIYNGVDIRFAPIKNFSSTTAYQRIIEEFQLSDKGPFILYVGSEHPRKNIKAVLTVLHHLKQQYPDIMLLKVGDPGLLSGRHEMLQLIDEHSLQNHVKLLGKVSDERLQDLYRMADVLLMPSYLEGFGMPIIEAMASGCPVVCSNAAAPPEIAGDAALLCDPDDTSAFSNAIIEIITNKKTNSSLRKAGIKRAKDFSWDNAAQQLSEIYINYL